jgi:hypothetical protein
MPRRHASEATAQQPDDAREAPRPSRPRKPSHTQPGARRLSKRFVQKADGRYLIYYDKA